MNFMNFPSRALVCNVFQKVACELRESSSYNWLRCEVNAIIETKEKEKLLRINRKTWLDLIKNLRESQKSLAEEFEKKKQEYNEEADKLSAEIDTSYCDNRDKLGTHEFGILVSYSFNSTMCVSQIT